MTSTDDEPIARIKITGKRRAEFDFRLLMEPDYAYGERDYYDVLVPYQGSDHLIVYNQRAIGRGVDMIMAADGVVFALRLPVSTSEIDLFINLIKNTLELAHVPMFRYGEDTIKADEVESIRPHLMERQREDLQNLIHYRIRRNNPIEIFGAIFPLSLDKIEQDQFRTGQEAYDQYLHNKQTQYPSTAVCQSMIMPTISPDYCLWTVSIKAGRIQILPTQPRVRDRKCHIVSSRLLSSRGAMIDYQDFLNNVDTSNRFDATHFIVKLSGKELDEIYKKCR